MNSRTRKKQSHIITLWRRGLVCLSLICALQVRPLTVLADESGTEPLTREDVTVEPLGHAWGEPTYTWNEDNASVTAKCICQRDKDHVLEETVKTTVTADDKTGKTTWTA